MNKNEYPLSQKEFYQMYILQQLFDNVLSVPDMYEKIEKDFPHKPNSRNYFYLAARHLKNSGEISLTYSNGRTEFFSITDRGKMLYEWYLKNYEKKFEKLKKVADLFVYEITGTGKRPSVQELSNDDRTYFSSLVSVKDIVRYLLLTEIQKTKQIIIGDFLKDLEKRYGWRSSKGWIYDIVREMESSNNGSDPLIIGKWDDERLRHKRIYQITSSGLHHLQQIAESTRHDILNAQHFLGDVLILFKKQTKKA